MSVINFVLAISSSAAKQSPNIISAVIFITEVTRLNIAHKTFQCVFYDVAPVSSSILVCLKVIDSSTIIKLILCFWRKNCLSILLPQSVTTCGVILLFLSVEYFSLFLWTTEYCVNYQYNIKRNFQTCKNASYR